MKNLLQGFTLIYFKKFRHPLRSLLKNIQLSELMFLVILINFSFFVNQIIILNMKFNF